MARCTWNLYEYVLSTSNADSTLWIVKEQPSWSNNVDQQQRSLLKRNTKLLEGLFAKRRDIHFHNELPIFIFTEEQDEAFFAKQGIIISSFAYPDPTGKKINRAVINALHTEADLLKLAAAI